MQQGVVTGAAYGIASSLSASSYGKVKGANERVRLGFIGLGHRGVPLIDAFKAHSDMEITALCDLYDTYIEFSKKRVEGNPFITKDYRRLLDRQDIDAIVIVTPDHWHALQFIDACSAGKDVYVEKPLSLVIAEGRKMVEAAARYKRITQVGLQRRSQPVYKRAVEMLNQGVIGRILSCHCFHVRNEGPMGIGNPPDSDPPAGLDWDTWLGPAPKVPYNENRCFYKFRWFRHYSGGQLTNWGTHLLDMILWGIGQNKPKEVMAMGCSAGIDDNREIPVTMQVNWKFPKDILVSYTQFNANGAKCNPKGSRVEFRGTKGTLYSMGTRIEVDPEDLRLEPYPAMNPMRRKENARQLKNTKKAFSESIKESGKRNSGSFHARNFLDCVKSRKPCNCPIEVGHRSTSTTLLGNIALDTKRHIIWDAEREQVVNDAEANKLLAYEYRAPWKFPV
jgi:predicted dehydrogenase